MRERDYAPRNKVSKGYQIHLGGELGMNKFEPCGICHGHKSRKDLRKVLNGIVRAKEKQAFRHDIKAIKEDQ